MVGTKKVIDAKGLCCPAPVVKMAKEWQKAKRGDTLEVVSTDPEIKINAKAWAECTGNKIVKVAENKGTITITIKIMHTQTNG